MKNFGAILVLLFTIVVHPTFAWFESCDNKIVLPAPSSIPYKPVQSPNYNGNYNPGSSCRYQIIAPQGFTITATCTMQIYRNQSNQCTTEYFYVMVNGSTAIMGSEYLCGGGTVTRTSTFNKLTLAYTSGSNNVGQFSCSLSLNCDCGWSVTGKIVNGRIANTNEYVSMVGMIDLSGSTIFCGGAIISPFYILSAAHCYTGSLATYSNVGALVGDQDYTIGSDTPYSALYRIANINKHSLFNANTNVNDIALLTTATEIQFNNGVGPACLPYAFSSTAFDSGVGLDVPGWGTTSFAGQRSSALRTVTLNTMDINTCKSKGMTGVTAGQLCTFTAGKDSCQYDSGGSLYYRYNKLYTILIVSYGQSCASSTPAVNTKVSAYLTWIKTNAQGANLCGA